MHYHLASSYYSFFFYIYIYFTGSQFTREPTKRTRFKCDEFSKKKRNVRSYVYTYVCTPMCVHIRVCNNTKRMFLVSISPLCRVFSIFWIFLYILLLPLLFFFFSLFVCYFIVASFFFYFPRCVIIISLNAQLTSYSELQLFTNLVK